MHKVWYRASKGSWFVTFRENGERKQIRLVQAPKTAEGRKLADAQLVRELKARPDTDDAPSASRWITVAHVLNGFLTHSREEHDAATATWYAHLVASFLAKWGKLRITQLRKRHVRAWLKESGYNSTSQNGALGAVKRAFNWAVEEEHISRNPIAHVRKPRRATRDRILEPAERELILSSIRDQSFRDFVLGMSLTGCRPGEVARVTRADVNLEHGVWVLAKHKTVKRTGKPRIVYLSPEALALTQRLMAKNPDGPIFRNHRGKRPWTSNAVRQRFKRLRRKFPQLKGVVAYTYRASFATDALEKGIPDATVAELLGHSGTGTLHRFYNKLSAKVTHLRNAAATAGAPQCGVAE